MPQISVIIPTFNRAVLLESSIESLAMQSLPRNQYEVIVVDDGSTDASAEVHKEFRSTVNLKYSRIEHSGISAAKNVGIFASRSPILLFFDDDDIADKRLLEQHLRVHQENPRESVAILGYTTWHPNLEVTPIMEYVTEIGQWLFAYPSLRDRQILGFTYFWGGRSSCKRSLLVKHGIFNRRFQSIVEDVELGYRLSGLGLKVVFHRNAISYMARPATFDEFCRRCVEKGKAQFLFSQLHPDPIVQQYCQVDEAESRWQHLELTLQDKMRRVRDIEARLVSQMGAEERDTLSEELRSLYEWTFEAFRVKGIVDAKETGEIESPQRLHDLSEKKGPAEGWIAKLQCRICEVLSAVLPPGATVIVVNGGDGELELPELEERRTWRLPQPSEDGEPEKLFAEGSEDAAEAPWIWPNAYYEFRLYAGKVRSRHLATVAVAHGDEALPRSVAGAGPDTPPSGEAFVMASPNPVPAEEGKLGTTTINWSTGDGSWGQVYVSQKRLNAYYYPADSAEAIAQLEALREKGAEFLLFPATTFWWLGHYPGFKQHLEDHYRVTAHYEDTCLIFDVR